MKTSVLTFSIAASLFGTTTFMFSLSGCVPARPDKPTTQLKADPSQNPTQDPVQQPTGGDQTPAEFAKTTLTAKSASQASGTVSFLKEADGIRVVAKVSGAAPGKHGFHIHEKGDCSAADATSAGGHYNPAQTAHAGPQDAVRHAGDLGNIEVAADGSGSLDVKIASAAGAMDWSQVVGKAVILHAAEDDLKSQPVGNAGARIACGVIDAAGPAPEQLLGEANLQSKSGSSAAGVVKFTKSSSGVRIVANVAGVPAGIHAIHIHEKGDCSAADATSAGGHFNPGAAAHAGPTAATRHAGDFGNITIDAAGKGQLDIKLADPAGFSDWASIAGKAVIIHAAADDLTTQPTGNAGARIACGVIAGPASTPVPTPTDAATCPAVSDDLFASIPAATEIALPKPLGFLEGALWLEKEQALMFSAWTNADGTDNGPLSTIHKLKDTTWSVFSERGVFASNGLAVDSNGEILAAMHGTQDVARIAADGTKKVVASKFNGQNLNSPNDLTVTKNGVVYFSDTSYSRGARPGQPVTGVYGVKTDGTVFLIDGERRQPNGISATLDGSTLYVGSAETNIYRYKIQPDGTAKADGTLIDLKDETDGLTVDCQGNVYATVPLKHNVTIINPAGKIIGTIPVAVNTTNVAFGGKDMKTLFITAAGKLYKVDLKVPGAPF